MLLNTKNHLVPNVSHAEGENPELDLSLDLLVSSAKNSHLEKKKKSQFQFL